MTIRDPDNRQNPRTEKGEQPFKDDREAFSQSDADLQTEVEGQADLARSESEGEQLARLEGEAADRFKGMQDEGSHRPTNRPDR